MTDRPNVLLIITDQHRADHLGCAGHPVLKTPHIDSLAHRGTRFKRFYVATPVCMPNRASLMTGRMSSVHGVRHNGIPLSRSAVTFVDVLHAVGVQTALIGKSHLQTQTGRPPLSEAEARDDAMQPPPNDLSEAWKGIYQDGSYDEELPAKWKHGDARVTVPFYGFEHVDLCKGHGDQVSGNYLQWLQARHAAPQSLTGPKNQLPGNSYTVPQAWRTAVPEDLYSTMYIADRAEAYLDTVDTTEKPFFLMASFPDPHHPFTPPGRYWDMYSPSQMPVPRAFHENNWTPPPYVADLIAAHERGEVSDDPIMAHGIGLKEALEARALTCGAITCIDDAVGRILKALERNGLTQNTIVIFTSDHGEHLGDHKLLLKGMAHYDELLRVPFIWADPERAAGDRTTEALASTIDISATILDRLGVRPFNGMQGRSLMSAITGPAQKVRSCVLIEDENQRTLPGLGRKPRERTIVTDDWRMSIFQNHAWGELYDLSSDPGEFNNLWGSKDHQDVRAALMEGLLQLMTEACDRSPEPLHQA